MNGTGCLLALLLSAGAVLPLRADVTRAIPFLPGERWWGGLNMLGTEMPFTEKSDLAHEARFDNLSNHAVPFFVSDRGRYAWCSKSVDFSVRGGVLTLTAGDGAAFDVSDGHGTLRGAFAAAAARHFPASGRMPPEKFFSAPQLNTWIEMTYCPTRGKLEKYVAEMRAHGVPPGILMIDDAWEVGYGDWDFDARRFPDAKGLVADLRAQGYEVLLWTCPFVSLDTPRYRELADRDVFLCGATRDPEALMNPLVCQWWNGRSAVLDLTKDAARAAFTDALRAVQEKYGVAGFKFDAGDMRYYSDRYAPGRGCWGRPVPSRPVEPAEQTELFAGLAREFPYNEFRAVYRMQGEPIVARLQDKRHDWPSLRQCLTDLLADGLMGYPFVCPDMVGGGDWESFFPGRPFDPELFVRSAQLHALSPMMQFSASPWRILDAEHQAHVRAAVDLRQRYVPLILELARQAARTGEPILRPLEYDFPGEGLADVTDEFTLGGRLLVAPQFRKGAATRSIRLPTGAWRADDGTVYEGPATVTVTTPLSRLPHFTRLFETAVSPDGRNAIRLETVPSLRYSVLRDGRPLLGPARIGMSFRGRGDLRPKVVSVATNAVRGLRTMPVYKKAAVDLARNETVISFAGDWRVRLAARDDGVAYRFETSFGGDEVTVLGETADVRPPSPATEALVGLSNGMFGDRLQGSWESAASVLRADALAATNAVAYLPVVFRSPDGTSVAVVETGLRDYPGWLFACPSSSDATLHGLFSPFPETHVAYDRDKVAVDQSRRGSRLVVGRRRDFLVETAGTRTYPWRGFAIASSAVRLCENDLVTALSDPPEGDFSWVRPGQSAWDWWNGWEGRGVENGCTTAVYERYVDFAGDHAIPYLVVDAGWSDFDDVYRTNPAFDLARVVSTGRKRGVGILLWMAAAQVVGREEEIAAHFAQTGVAGFKVDWVEREDAESVRFLETFARAAARHWLVVEYHGAPKLAGLNVRFPNVLSAEAVRGLEVFKWPAVRGDFPANDVLNFFVRMTAGPMDYTPGAMVHAARGQNAGDYLHPAADGTRCHQLALYVLYESPLQMLADAPANYEANRESLAFITGIPTVWDETRGLHGEPPSFVVAARRKGGDWWVGGLADWNGRDVSLETDFLGAGEWSIELFADGDDAATHPASYVRTVRTLRSGERLPLRMACGGGFAARFVRRR